MQRRVAALLFGALVALLVLAAPAAAAPAGATGAPTAPSGARAAAVASSALGTTPATGFALTLDPGVSSTQALGITNQTPDQRLTVRVEPVDATRDTRGTTTYAVRATNDGTGSWVTAATNEVVLEPGTRANVALTVAVPDGAAAGDRAVAGLHVFVQRAQSTNDGAIASTTLPDRYVPVSVTVAGTPAAQLAITRVQAKQQGSQTFLAVTVRNSGALAATATGAAQSAGNSLRRPIEVSLQPRKERTLLLDWPAFDAARGADVEIELEYGDGDTASWIGNVPAPADGSAPTTVPSGAPTTGGGAGNGASSSGNALGIVVAVVVALLVLGAGGWLVYELARSRGGAVQRMPIDIASLPPLQVQMDPAHTEVLNALVTQVGALGEVIERLADRVGMPVAVPPGPPLLTPSNRRRRRGHARPRPGHDEPVVTTAAAPPASVTTVAPVAPVVPPGPGAPPPTRVEEYDDIAAATGALAPPAPAPAPTFIPPPPVTDDIWPSDAELDALIARRRERGAQ
jgi:hypothetical protein